jgi:uncharacterized RDD family membrane protein YckC
MPDATPPRYAGFWIRVAANVLDALIIGAVNRAMVATGSGAWVGITDTAIGTGPGNYDITTPLLVIVVVIGFWIFWGATPGKMILRLRIVDALTGQRAKAWQCIGRYFMALLALAPVGIGYFWILIDPRKQGWHDKIVNTLVVRR